MAFGIVRVVSVCSDLVERTQYPVEGPLLGEEDAYLRADDQMCISRRYQVFSAGCSRPKKASLSINPSQIKIPERRRALTDLNSGLDS